MKNIESMTRRSFLVGASSTAAVVAGGCMTNKVAADTELDFQAQIDRVKGADYRAYMEATDAEVSNWTGRFAAFQKLEDAFARVLEGVKTEIPEPGNPIVWLVYNMGIVVKTSKCCFSVDLVHRRAPELAPYLDFAMITHNHLDHYTEEFYRAMDGARKTVISNFKDNYRAHFGRGKGGFTRAEKRFTINDVTVKTSLTDHNGYLVDFTTVFEIAADGFRILHSGDCSNVAKLNPPDPPDLWVVHPRCGLNVVDGVSKFNPGKVVIAHLAELGHDHWRWTWANGKSDCAAVEKVGGKAIVPVWGDRII